MKKIVKRSISMLLCLAMVIGFIPATMLSASAATIGTKVDNDKDSVTGTSTGLDADSFSTEDYIALPIEIYDYKADGMLFQYAEPNLSGTHKAINTFKSHHLIQRGWDFTRGGITVDNTTPGYSSATTNRLNHGYNITYMTGAKDEETVNNYVRFKPNSYYNGNVIDRYAVTLGTFDDVVNDSVRYMAIAYRGYGFRSGVNVAFRETASAQCDTVCQVPLEGDTYWHTLVIDLETAKNSSGTKVGTTNSQWGNFDANKDPVRYVSLYPFSSGSSSNYLDIAYIAFFDSMDKAKEFNDNSFKAFTLDDNMAFGLLGSSRTYEDTDSSETYISFRRISQTYKPGDTSTHNKGGWYNENTNPFNGDYNTSGASSIWQIDDSRTANLSGTKAYLGYDLIATISGAATTAGLLDPVLGEDGNPVYKPETVYYIAKLLQATLPIKEKNSSGDYPYNYDYVMGEEYDYTGDNVPEELAQFFRDKITGGLGTYEKTAAKNLKGKGGLSNITTYMDAAYFLLNNLFVRDSYNIPDDTYDHLILNRATIDDEQVYVFDAGFGDSSMNSSTKYGNGVISNTSAASKPMGYYSATEMTTYYPFLPLTSTNNASGMTKTPYRLDDAAWNNAGVFNTYENRNYNYVLRSHGEFVYNEDLFFEFEGDDDVYLFINGQLVLDIGGAHPIAKQRIELDKYVNAAKANVNNPNVTATDRDLALAVAPGETCTFDFFYMERHGYGANMRIVTNIEVVDTVMDVEKKAYQDSYELPDGAAIDVNTPVEFSFTLTNEGNENSDANSYLKQLSFTDEQIGITLDWKNGLSCSANSRAITPSGQTLTANEVNLITFCHTDANGNVDIKNFPNNDALKAYLTNEDANNPIMKVGSTLEIRGIYVQMENTDFSQGPWVNTVTVDAMTNIGTGLRGTDDIRLNNALAPVYYMWADHELTIDQDALISDINEASDNGKLGELLNKKIKSIQAVTLTNAAGIPKDNNNVVINNNVITVDYKVPGTYLDHIRVNYTDIDNKAGNVVLPIHTYVVDVEDEVFVLDYGLKVNLSEGNVLTDESTLKVYGQATTTVMEGISEVSPNYIVGANGNNLSFTASGKEGTFTLSNGDGLGLAVKDSSLAKGTKLIVAELSKIGNEKLFAIRKQATVDGVDYYTIKSHATNKYVSIGQNGLTLEAYNGDNKQLWYFGDSGKILSKTSDIETIFALYAEATVGATANYSTSATAWTLTPAESKSKEQIEFTFTDDNELIYTPKTFMEDAETAYLPIRVYENGFTPSTMGVTDINHEVEMFKAVTVIPANVVYYEDDFPAITYFNDDGEAFENKITTDGSSGNLWQSNDQNENYGHDSVYEEGGVPVSGDSVTTITIDSVEQDKRVAEFTFAGTGFELISRTTATDSASIVVKVLDAGNNVIKSIPVITEFDNDANGTNKDNPDANGNDIDGSGSVHTEVIYQVPVIKVDDLPFGNYTVQICGMASLAKDENGKIVIENGQVKYKTTYLYIDGIRIYNPLGGGNVTGLENEYIESEQNITFSEIRDMILNSQLGVVEFFTDSWTVGTGLNTYTENRIGAGYDGDGGWTKEYKGNVVTDINDYLAMGPNNEVYLNGISSNQAVVLYVRENTAKQGTLQIGMHLINEKAFFGLDGKATNGVIKLGVLNEEGKPAWQSFHADLCSGTELYYDIDYTRCPISNGFYQVVLYVEDGMVSFTNLKHKGLTIDTRDGNALEVYFKDGKLMSVQPDGTEQEVNAADYVDFQLLADQLRSTEVVQPEPPAPPATEPEATEPEATEPEATEPEATEPKPTEPKPTEPEAAKCAHSYDDNVDGTCNVCGIKREDVETRQVVHMFRMYNPNTGEHFYTGSEVEKNDLIEAGWQYEGVGFTFPANTGAPVYRLFQPSTGEHLYTMDKAEKEKLEAEGWNYEGVAFNSAYDTEAVQHRLHNPNETVGAYHFTFSEEEKQNLINAGWEYQGIGWYSCWK